MIEQEKTNDIYNINSEPQLTEYIISNRYNIPVIRPFPVLWKREYHVRPPYSQYGVGDLIFMDESRTNFLVAEIKFLSRRSGKTAKTKRNKHRKKVWQQAHYYAKCLKCQFRHAHVFYVGITNENLKSVRMREMIFQKIQP